MKTLSALSIRAQLTLLAAMFVLPAVGITIWSGLRAREERIQEARVATQKLAAAIAAAYESRLASGQQLMTALAKLPAVKSRDPAVQALLRDMVALNPDYTNVSIADAAGDIWASANPARFNIADRRHFQGVLATGRLASGEYVTSRATLRPTFFFGYPILDERGKVSGVVSVGFDLQFARLFESARLPPGSSFSLVDRNGIVVARNVDPERYVGRSIPASLLARMVHGPEEATTIGPSYTDEVRVQTYRKLQLSGEQTPYLYVRAAIPYAGVIAGANRALAKDVALLLSCFLAALAFASFVGKRTIVDRIARLETASHRLAEGDLGVRVGELVRGGELGQLGRSFDRMAEQLALREKALQESERNLLQAQKMETVGRLAGGVAHDFNNQLTAILSSSEHLVETLGGDDVAVVGRIRDAALRSARLVRQLLAFARKEPSRRVPVDLHRTVDEVVALLSHSVDKRIQLHTRLEAEPSLVRGDPDRLHTALLNLALNARDAIPGGGAITFATRRVELDATACAALPFDVSPGPHLELRVIDTGVGLSEAARAHLFEPFFTTKGAGTGSGLGLAEVYGTVQAHQGAITVESAANRGTAFAVLLPAAEGDRPEADRELPPGRPPSRRPLRVLIADDERNVRFSLGLLLRTGGHEVIECANGEEAVRAHQADAARIDVVILDMVMPDMSGKEVLAKIRERAPDVPVIVSSGFSAGAEVEGAGRGAAVFHLAKPYTAEQLERALADACSRS
jgi:signal transduction histidine kinase/CheY-like chemotaxis protein